GRLADRSSRKRAFLLGLAVFTIASALCAVAQNVPMLVGARVLQAAGAAALVPTSLGLLLAAFPPARRARAIGALTAIGGIGAAAVVIVLFLVRSARHPSPVISFDLLRIRSFSLTNIASLLFAICFSAMLLSFMLWNQTVWGYSALRTGLAFAPGTFLMPFVA